LVTHADPESAALGVESTKSGMPDGQLQLKVRDAGGVGGRGERLVKQSPRVVLSRCPSDGVGAGSWFTTYVDTHDVVLRGLRNACNQGLIETTEADVQVL